MPEEGYEEWGGGFKRIEIHLPSCDPARQFVDSTGRCHILIDESVQCQKLIEVINQAATMERLMDALRWAMTDESGLGKYRVDLCHPTTSSGDEDSNVADHDLVLSGPSGVALFEVSDVASSKDGNRKEEKDLRSLGLLVEGQGESKFRVTAWPPGRLFLVVSREWRGRIDQNSRRWVQNRTVAGIRVSPHLKMQRHDWNTTTGIFEIHRGAGFGHYLSTCDVVDHTG